MTGKELRQPGPVQVIGVEIEARFADRLQRSRETRTPAAASRRDIASSNAASSGSWLRNCGGIGILITTTLHALPAGPAR